MLRSGVSASVFITRASEKQIREFEMRYKPTNGRGNYLSTNESDGSLARTRKRNSTLVRFRVKNNTQLLGRVRTFDRHCNMVLENVLEMWTEVPKTGEGKKKSQPK